MYDDDLRYAELSIPHTGVLTNGSSMEELRSLEARGAVTQCGSLKTPNSSTSSW